MFQSIVFWCLGAAFADCSSCAHCLVGIRSCMWRLHNENELWHHDFVVIKRSKCRACTSRQPRSRRGEKKRRSGPLFIDKNGTVLGGEEGGGGHAPPAQHLHCSIEFGGLWPCMQPPVLKTASSGTRSLARSLARLAGVHAGGRAHSHVKESGRVR